VVDTVEWWRGMLFITNGHKTLYGAVVEKKSLIRCTNSIFNIVK
jgi:hypothetical protein